MNKRRAFQGVAVRAFWGVVVMMALAWAGASCKKGLVDVNGGTCGNGVVESEEQCDSPFGPCCDDETCRYKTAETVCRAAAGECDVLETCSGEAAECPLDLHQSEGTACIDGTCINGICTEGPIASGAVIIWDTNLYYLQHNPFHDALADKANWTQVPYGVTDYVFTGDAMIENDHFYLFLFSNDEDSPALAAKVEESALANEIYKVHDTGYRNFGMGNMWVEILENTEQEVIIHSAEKGMRFGDPPVPITSEYRVTTQPWLDVRPVENQNQQGWHDKKRMVAFVFEDAARDVILDADHHVALNEEGNDENVYPEAGCRGILNFHRHLNEDKDFMWLLTYPPGVETNSLTYAGMHNDRYWEWDCRPCDGSVGANYAYLEEKVILGALRFPDNWKREDVGETITTGDSYTSTFTAPYAGLWRIAGVFADDEWSITNRVSEVTVAAGAHFTYVSPRDGTLEYLLVYMIDRSADTPTDVFTVMDIYRQAIFP